MQPKPTEKPVGQLFTHVYLERGSPLADAESFRSRLAGFLNYDFLRKPTSGSHDMALASYIKQELGLTVPYGGYAYDFESLLKKARIEHVLNLITVIWRYLSVNAKEYRRNELVSVRAEQWLSFVQRVLKEENLRYSVDSAGGVHFLVDAEFEQNRYSVLQCLQDKRYAGVRDAYEAAYGYLDPASQDTKASVRSMFESVEILVRLMIPAARNLNKKLVESDLTELVISKCGNDAVATQVMKELLVGLGWWVNALHNYRHGHGTTDPVAPSLELATYVLSSGSSFLRWLVTIDAQESKSSRNQ